MTSKLYYYYILSLTLFFSVSISQEDVLRLPLKAVNLGAWLVAERWMYSSPSIFDGIENSDLLDGNQVQLKSTKFNNYLSAEGGGGAALVANRNTASGWETFRLWRKDSSTFSLRVFGKQFLGLDNQSGNVVAISTTAGSSETFSILRSNDKLRLRASNGHFLQANSDSSVTADYDQGNLSDWGDENPSVFKIDIIKKFGGEYQVTNGYGADKASQVMREHWKSYIVENDFRFMSENGLNAVRIPVGWWIKYDLTVPLKPFVQGSLQALDNAFTWAQKYNMKVIVCLHAVPGSQNGNDHSGTRDGYQNWGYDYIDETVSVIDFLASRYAKRPSLVAIELMNEPFKSDGVSLDALSKYYQAGYNAVRKYSGTAYVILSNRLGTGDDSNTELVSLASSLSRSVIDVHYYSVFDTNLFGNMSPEETINYIYSDRAAQLGKITKPNGPLTFVGEWTAAWLKDAAVEDFAKAQINVYGKATFGWAFWSYKNQYNSWSLEYLIRNNIINLKP